MTYMMVEQVKMRRKSRDATISSATQPEWETLGTFVVYRCQSFQCSLDTIQKVDASSAFLAVNGCAHVNIWLICFLPKSLLCWIMPSILANLICMWRACDLCVELQNVGN